MGMLSGVVSNMKQICQVGNTVHVRGKVKSGMAMQWLSMYRFNRQAVAVPCPAHHDNTYPAVTIAFEVGRCEMSSGCHQVADCCKLKHRPHIWAPAVCRMLRPAWAVQAHLVSPLTMAIYGGSWRVAQSHRNSQQGPSSLSTLPGTTQPQACSLLDPAQPHRSSWAVCVWALPRAQADLAGWGAGWMPLQGCWPSSCPMACSIWQPSSTAGASTGMMMRSSLTPPGML